MHLNDLLHKTLYLATYFAEPVIIEHATTEDDEWFTIGVYLPLTGDRKTISLTRTELEEALT